MLVFLKIWFGCHKSPKKRHVLIIGSLCVFLLIYSTFQDTLPGENRIPPSSQTQRYLVSSLNCRIPDVDPFNEEVMEYVYKVKPIRCTKLGLLSYIDKSDGLVTLHIDIRLLAEYSIFNIKCCYSKIYRYNYYNATDDEIRYSPCVEFGEKTVLYYPFIKVECKNFFQTVYSNVHAAVIHRNNKITAENTRRPFSVLLVGIDSMSHINLRRTMPKTYSYLQEHFYSFKGYNKIGDNTFPNLMAVLTGQDYEKLSENCTGKVKYNNCDLIWNTFRRLGYITGYAEDVSNIGSFHYLRTGFGDPPTDYYYRPYIIAAEQLGITNSVFCTGPEGAGERIFNAVTDFSVSLKDVPSFGLFWMNSFSHDDINMPSAMDEKVLTFLSDTSFKSSLKNTIMIFFSDHGFRFGDIRYTHTGWLEERLPFIFFHIPQRLKKSFRKKYDNFVTNTDSLTTPYDLYNTLQDILEMGSDNYKAVQGTGCPKCQSLFEEIPRNRTCKDAGISQHWCTCTGHSHVNSNDSVRQVAEYIVEEINNFIKDFPDSHDCSVYRLEKVTSAGMSEYYLNEEGRKVRYFLVMVETKPLAVFEATVETYYDLKQSYFKLLGDISRVNRYKSYSDCVHNVRLKKYCYCNEDFNVLRSVICSIVRC